MNRSARILLFLLIAASSISTSAFAQTSVQTDQTTSAGQTVTTTVTTHTTASDDLAVGDPLGNRGMTPRADAGPANTQTYCAEGSTAEHCVRATRRNQSPTTWQHDCATGLSKSCANR